VNYGPNNLSVITFLPFFSSECYGYLSPIGRIPWGTPPHPAGDYPYEPQWPRGWAARWAGGWPIAALTGGQRGGQRSSPVSHRWGGQELTASGVRS